MTAALEGGEWSAARPGRTLPPRKNRYPFYRKLCIYIAEKMYIPKQSAGYVAVKSGVCVCVCARARARVCVCVLPCVCLVYRLKAGFAYMKSHSGCVEKK